MVTNSLHHARHDEFQRIWQACREEVSSTKGSDGIDAPAPAAWLVGELLALQSHRQGRPRDEMVRAIRILLEENLFAEHAGDTVVDPQHQTPLELQVELLVRALHRAGVWDEAADCNLTMEVPPQLVG